ncbi:MAG: YdeI/OmpD-associated family protein [Treponemataceae bacterium]|nr:YdeI/OmpD-associated family protein [Treponemataceae bacterium]
MNDSIKTFYTSSRAEWRNWLSKNYKTESEIWFIFPMKETGEASLSYNDAVEEALCFGWIDSTIKHIDETHRAQHFTPRKNGSPYSRPNIERLIWLEKQNMLTDEIRESVLPLIKVPYEFPEDIIAAIKENTETWKNYQNFPEGYKRIRIAYIDAARNRPEEFKKRLESFIKKTHRNVLIKGFGGIDKYYSLS